MPQPRIVTPDPPDVAGTLADEWAEWLEKGAGVILRPWQRLVLDKALQVDSAGELIWDEVGISVGRQAGKSWLIKSLALARCHFADHFGEAQEIGHLANNLVAARRIQRQSWRWAAQNDLTVRRGIGDERILWPDGSVWFLSSLKAVYGSSAHVALVDEAWDCTEDDVLEGVSPIVIEREQSQFWLLSTANELATPSFLNFRRKALAGAPRVLLIEWSADPATDDLDDPATWFAASPHWSKKRERMIAAADPKSRRFQYLNCWPDGGTAVDLGWPVGFAGCPPTEGPPPSDGVGAIEVSQDRQRYGVAVAVRTGVSVAVWTEVFADLERAVEWLNDREPVKVFVGVSLKAEVSAFGSFLISPAGTAETKMATPMTQSLVSQGRLSHDHSEGLLAEVAHARVTAVETGDLLSAKRSTGPIPRLKAACWAAWGAATGIADVEAPAIFRRL